ncbi:GSCFA domain-containing protein [Paracrocinitomix mangrovi]|uniref:GSCFA domain-containing protein n=1 Tax=Paracrocinitomix mangrovi TaxID=2862509 RepID=UPI001C8D3B56|nr:GSCFA domain-containing protein [Paracrocinitomix mangrovi]UKN01820.1 GSCFA domain-containing protein [Paracrocinitomix mangrovi]
MKWRTEVQVENNNGYIRYNHSMVAIGSCFADEIGGKLKDGGMDISVNPFGVIFNPVSIMQLIQNTLDGNLLDSLILERDMKFFHYGFHSKVYGTDKNDLTKNIESIQYNIQRRLLEGDRLFLTFGTAWVYRLIEQNTIVANCHKMPANLFNKELIDLDKLKERSVLLFERIFEENPKLKVMITVSPVRHVKDGLHENNISKGLLHLLCAHLVNHFKQVTYFPAFEMLVDDLRDYRFYKEDLIHPNNQAVNYVFDHFKQSQFDDETMAKFSLHEKLKKAKDHHFINASIEEVRKHEDYINNLEAKLTEL